VAWSIEKRILLQSFVKDSLSFDMKCARPLSTVVYFKNETELVVKWDVLYDYTT